MFQLLFTLKKRGRALEETSQKKAESELQELPIYDNAEDMIKALGFSPDEP